jgi:hypothetical protein
MVATFVMVVLFSCDELLRAEPLAKDGLHSPSRALWRGELVYRILHEESLRTLDGEIPVESDDDPNPKIPIWLMIDDGSLILSCSQ